MDGTHLANGFARSLAPALAEYLTSNGVIA
jgi:hypothetical protein